MPTTSSPRSTRSSSRRAPHPPPSSPVAVPPPPNNEDSVNDMHAGLPTPPEVQAAIDDGARIIWKRQYGYAVPYEAGTTPESPQPSELDPAELKGALGRLVAAPNTPGVVFAPADTIDLTHDDDNDGSLVPVPTFINDDSLISPNEMAYFLALRRENINQALELDQLRMRATNLGDQLRGEQRASVTLRNDAVRMAGLYATTTTLHLNAVKRVVALQNELRDVRKQARRDLTERELNVQQLWRHHNKLFVGHIKTVLVNATTQLETLGNQMANVRPFPGVNINTDLPSDDDVFAVMRVIRNMRQRQDEQEGDDHPPEYHRRRAPPA